MEYGKVLAYYLEQQGMTPAELAHEIGSPRSTINALLKGRAKEPTLGKAKAIADALANFAEEQGKIAEESTNELN